MRSGPVLMCTSCKKKQQPASHVNNISSVSVSISSSSASSNSQHQAQHQHEQANQCRSVAAAAPAAVAHSNRATNSSRRQQMGTLTHVNTMWAPGAEPPLRFDICFAGIVRYKALVGEPAVRFRRPAQNVWRCSPCHLQTHENVCARLVTQVTLQCLMWSQDCVRSSETSYHELMAKPQSKVGKCPTKVDVPTEFARRGDSSKRWRLTDRPTTSSTNLGKVGQLESPSPH
jgi:hypothetical protein